MKILIVDDDEELRQFLRSELEELRPTMPEMEVVGEAGDGIEAVEAIERLRPDLVFLDIEMPLLNGLEVIEELGPDPPAIVFVTAYNQYAVEAFRVSAVDYLLKPAEADRLRQAIEKVRRELLSRERIDQIERLLGTLHRQQYLQRVIGRRSNLRWPIRVDSICAFVADHEVVYASTSEGKQMINFSLRDLEQRLDPEQFIRVRRNLIVNFAYVKEIEFNDGGHGVIRLTTGETISISRRLNPKLQARLRS
jgi:two-component system LytT family response regulator